MAMTYPFPFRDSANKNRAHRSFRFATLSQSYGFFFQGVKTSPWKLLFPINVMLSTRRLGDSGHYGLSLWQLEGSKEYPSPPTQCGFLLRDVKSPLKHSRRWTERGILGAFSFLVRGGLGFSSCFFSPSSRSSWKFLSLVPSP